VQFFDGSSSLGTAILSGGSAQLSTSSLAGGSHSITATYSGNANYSGSTSPALTQTVNQASTTISVSSSPNPSTYGQSVTFTGAVSPAGATGTVQFFDGPSSLGTATLSGGTAQLSTSSLAVGSHSITTTYSGNANYSGSTSPALTQTVTTSSGGWSNGYSYRRTITIDHTKVPNTDQLNFPVLISGTYSFLATTGNGGNVTSANGYDIIFTSDSAGSTILNFEQEKYVATTGEVDYWVQIPTVSHSSDTVFYMFYGNANVNSFQSSPTAAWDSNYMAVYHFADHSASTTVKESTANNVSGTANQNTSNTATAGQIDGAMAFNGTTDTVTANSSAINVSGSFSLEAWVNTPGNANPGTILTNAYAVGGNGYALHMYYSTPTFEANGNNTYYNVSALAISANAWHQVVGTRSGTLLSIYVDGVLSATATGASSTPANNTLNIGNYGGSGEYFGGTLDEMRISSTALSADWITTEYNNQSSPSTFYSVGSAQ
jgi:hypothetical protein